MATKEQTLSLVERAKAGDETLMPELWESVKALVAWYAGKVAPRLPPSAGLTFDDLYNSGYLALVEAVWRYDPVKGGFIPVFMLCLKTAFAEASGTRRHNDPLCKRKTRSLDEPRGENSDFTLCDTIADPNNHYDDVERRVYIEQLHKELEVAINRLDDVGATTIRNRFFGGQTQREIGEALGVSVSRAQQIEKRALHKLRSPKIARPLWQFVEENTPYYMHVGINRFNNTRSSAPEQITILRERLEHQYAHREERAVLPLKERESI